jgi:deoxyribonuclease-4
MIKLGSHINLSGDEMLLGASKKAVLYGCNCFMIYTGAPQNTIRKSIETFKIYESKKFLNEHDMKLEDIVVHAPYIINLASPFPDKREFTIDFITEEVKRTYQIGSKRFVIHPGSYIDNHDEGIERISFCLNKIIENTKDLDVVLLIETMCGKGTEMGKNFEEISSIINNINDKSRIGVCLDTCHIHDAGYDLNNFDSIVNEFDEKIGLQYLYVIHVNDSKNKIGAKKDRHENIGYGEIGFNNLLNVIYHEKLLNTIKILETPFVNDNAPYKEEIKMIKNKEFVNFKENL